MVDIQYFRIFLDRLIFHLGEISTLQSLTKMKVFAKYTVKPKTKKVQHFTLTSTVTS